MRFQKSIPAAILAVLLLTGCAAPVPTDEQTPPRSELSASQITATETLREESTASVIETEREAETETLPPPASETPEPSESVPQAEPEPTEPPKPTELSKPTEPPPTPSTHTHQYAANTVAPTCTEQGYMIHTCECGESYRDGYTASLGYSFIETAVPATSIAQGYTEHTCSRCGYSYRDNYTAVQSWDTEACIRQVCADMNAYITAIGLVADPTCESWVAPDWTHWDGCTEAWLRNDLKCAIDDYKANGYTHLYVTYAASANGGFDVYVKYWGLGGDRG